MTTDEEVTNYNLFKKLAQLDKVVQYLNVHLVERSFQIETLRKRYNDAEDQIFKNYEKQMTKFQEELSVGPDIETAQKIYKAKYDVVETGFIQISKMKSEEFNDIVQNIEKEIKNMQLFLKECSDELDKEKHYLTKELTEKNKQFVSKIKKLQFDHRKELSTHDKQAVEKYKKTEHESEEKIKQLKADYSTLLQGTKENFKNQPGPQNVLDIKQMRNWKLKLSNWREALEKAESDADFYIQNFAEMMHNMKPKKEMELNEKKINYIYMFLDSTYVCCNVSYVL